MFLQFTSKRNGKSVFILKTAISAVTTDNDNDTVIYVTGDTRPFAVKETVEEVLKFIE